MFRKHSRYKLYDAYDEPDTPMELLGAFSNMRQVQKAACERHIDTDGECVLLLYKFNLTAGKYEIVDEWYFNVED